jgi:hypothetical protein
MFVTMQNSKLIDKLILIACGDIDLIQDAIRCSAAPNSGAGLKNVVQYIIAHRRLSEAQGVLTSCLEPGAVVER